MLKIRRIAGRNWITYPDVELKFEHPVTVIRGLNKDSKTKDGLNRVGKSLVPAILPRLAFGTPPQPMKGRKPKGDFRKDTVLEIDVARDKNTYRIQGYFDRTSRMRIIEGKANRGIRLKKDAEVAVREVIPHNEEQFYSTVYIDGRRPALFQYGTDAQRFEFFEKVFDFGVYRNLNELLKPFLQDSAKAASELTVLQEQLIALGDEPDTKVLNTAFQKAKTEFETVKKDVETCQSRMRRLDVYLSALQNIPDRKPQDPTAIQKALAAVSHAIENAVKIQEHSRLFAETEETRTRLTQALIPYKDIVIDPSIKSTVDALREKCDQAHVAWDAYTQAQATLERERARLAALPVLEKAKKASIDILQAEIQKVQSRLQFMERLTVTLQGNLEHEKTCPVCAGSFDEKQHKDFSMRMEKSKTAAQSRLKALRDGLAWHKQADVVAHAKSLCVKPEHTEEEWDEQFQAAQSRYQTMRNKVIVERRLAALPVLEKPQKAVDLTDLREQHEDLSNQLQLARRIQQAREMVKSLKITFSQEEAARRLTTLKTTLPKLENRRDQLEARVSNLRSQGQTAQERKARLKTVRQRIADLEQTLTDQPILDGLKAAFGSKGLVKQRTRLLAESFEKALNDYSGFVFDEPVSFRLNVTDTQFSIFAARNGLEGEVRSLSGQESRAFSLITLLVLHRFIPSHLRCNVIILDECEANMDAPSKRLFAEKLIPELLRFVDHVLVITPDSRSELYIPNAEEFYAIKENGKSKLVPFRDLQAAA